MKEEILRALIEWNPWFEGEFPEKLIGYRRGYEITSYLDIEEIKILVGARRVGKSTLLYNVIKHVFQEGKKILYINFQDEVLSKYTLSEIYYTYLERDNIDYLFLDEVQECSEWVHFVRKMYDTKKLKQIWISGSNSSLIKQEYAELLTGRNLTLNVSVLSFREYLLFHQIEIPILPVSSEKESLIKKHFNEYLNHGAFPAVVLRSVYKKELLLNYFNDFIYKDIGARYDVNSIKVKELAIYLATNTSSPYSFRNIARALGIHPNTVNDYLIYLQETYLFDVIYKFDYSLKNQLGNEKKSYIVDVGLARAISFEFFESTAKILENLVYIELKRREYDIYFHKGQKECDFVLKKGFNIIEAIQVCHSLHQEKTRKREITGLIEAMSTHNLKEGLILTLDEEAEETIDGYMIHIAPTWKWMLTGDREGKGQKL